MAFVHQTKECWFIVKAFEIKNSKKRGGRNLYYDRTSSSPFQEIINGQKHEKKVAYAHVFCVLK